MKTNNKDTTKIDAAFRTLTDHSHDMEEEAAAIWKNDFEKKVAKQNFYRFGIRHFNIYLLLSSILCLLLLTLYLYQSGTSSVLPKTPTSSSKQDTVPLNSSSNNSAYLPTSEDTISFVQNAKDKTGNNKMKQSLSDNQAGNNTIHTDTVDTVEFTNNNTTNPETQSSDKTSTGTTPWIKIEKRTITVEQLDTLETIDTIRSERKWRKMNRKK